MRYSVLSFSVGWAAVACCSIWAICAMPTPSYGEGPQAQQSNPGQEDPDYNGEDLTRPQRSIETRFIFQTSSGTTTQTDRGTLLLRATWKADLDQSWKLGLLRQAPVVDKTTFGPTGSDQEFGIGDAAVQAILSHAIDQYWAFGFGARLVAPTAEDLLGTGRWQILPGFGVGDSLPEIGPDTYFACGPIRNQLCR